MSGTGGAGGTDRAVRAAGAHHTAATSREGGAGGTDGVRGLRIVRLANFVTPSSGGLRTALRELGRGYLAAGHEPVLVVPGDTESDERTAQGRVVTVAGPELPGTGGYRVLAGRARLRTLLEELAPDRLEVSDRTTLRWTGEWARRHRIPSVMVSHETADGVLRTWGVPGALAERTADRLNRRSAWSYSRIVCTTEWAEREFVRIGARNVVRAPLGVELDRCRPGRRSQVLRARYTQGAGVLLLLCSRLSVEKRPGTALDALAGLRASGVRAALVVAGEGPLRAGLVRRAREERLPVHFLGHVADREALADLQAAADICLAPGPAETFGLSALEALACGTPVVASASSALPEVVGEAGIAAPDRPGAFADAVRELLDRGEGPRRAAARARAEAFGWDRAVAAFLAAHDAPTLVPARPEAVA
ncbi:glycosyltransferase [Streptomyces wuyuanensis]|uniref:Alpha-1,6-mannosyltransferase n=1 Tax=Streptomyces wuyuanensis TaxID=1196353 RepID=A0A1G9XX32_9ACTN|nr:alpha-1,6-mannosyltransferase [Streptomyces wuyuanensis]